MNAVLASILHPEKSEFKVTHLEMIKGISGHGFYDTLTIPIIENTARECELTDRLRQAILEYPKATAVLVRRHGVYVWGESWIKAKTQFECYEYLFEAAVRMHSMGINSSLAPIERSDGDVSGVKQQETDSRKRMRVSTRDAPKCIVLDIEGTVAPISYVSDTLFPYARERLRTYFEENAGGKNVQTDLGLLRVHASEQGKPFPGETAPHQDVVQAAVELCEADMNADRKTTALKSVQGHIWTQGFSSGELKAPLFDDVPSNIVSWYRQGIKTYIYSSGSRQAQKDLFGHTTVGDLRPYLQGFFDTSSGPKVLLNLCIPFFFCLCL